MYCNEIFDARVLDLMSKKCQVSRNKIEFLEFDFIIIRLSRRMSLKIYFHIELFQQRRPELKLSFQALEIRDIIIIIYCYYYYSDMSGCNVHISFYLFRYIVYCWCWC